MIEDWRSFRENVEYIMRRRWLQTRPKKNEGYYFCFNQASENKNTIRFFFFLFRQKDKLPSLERSTYGPTYSYVTAKWTSTVTLFSIVGFF